MSKRFKRPEPKKVKIQDEEYPVLFSLAALETMESELDVPFVKFFDDMAKGNVTPRQQAVFLRACMNAGGTEVTTEELLEGLSYVDFADVLSQLLPAVSEQMPEAEEDAKNPA